MPGLPGADGAPGHPGNAGNFIKINKYTQDQMFIVFYVIRKNLLIKIKKTFY